MVSNFALFVFVVSNGFSFFKTNIYFETKIKTNFQRKAKRQRWEKKLKKNKNKTKMKRMREDHLKYLFIIPSLNIQETKKK